MVIIGMGCGLGNQMFQYAFYYSLLRKFPGMKIKVDTKYAFEREHNGIEIDKVFGVLLPNECYFFERVLYSEIPVMKSYFANIFMKVYSKLGIHKRNFYKQKDYTEFYSEVYEVIQERNMYLLGVWANEKYFKEYINEIINDIFVFSLPINEYSRSYENEILQSESVSIHVRKGDFVAYHNHILDKKYYDKAMEIMEKNKKNIHYYVFSDDEMYARSLFSCRRNISFITHNRAEDSWMDMYLMSVCKNNIIANSSFSFWGALLNKNENKIVIAPNIPFKTCKYPFIYEGWIKIDE